VLSSPIILYDCPEMAPESPGDLFDASEIDDLLVLSVLSLAEADQDEPCRTTAGSRRRRQTRIRRRG
jgi:hypothetical protein